MGAVRLCEDAGLPLGYFLAAARRETRSKFRDSQRTIGLARGARRVSLDFAASDRDAGRHRASFGGTTTDAGGLLSVDVRSAKYFPGERRRGASPLGHGVLAASLLRTRWPRGSGIFARAAIGRRR